MPPFDPPRWTDRIAVEDVGGLLFRMYREPELVT
jgi:hypothetical protein